jgi:AcrR family transcriptional regulator
MNGRKQREISRKKMAILRAARTLFAKKGLEATTVDEIAQRAEVSKGAVYLYFRNKSDVYWGVTSLSLEKLKRWLLKHLSKDSNPRKQLQILGEMYYHFTQKYPLDFELIAQFHISRLNVSDSDSMGVKCYQLAQELLYMIEHILRIGQEKKIFREDFLPEKMSFLLWGEMNGVIQVVQKLRSQESLVSFSPEDLIFDHIRFQLERVCYEKPL